MSERDIPRFTVGDRIRVTVEGTLADITPTGSLTIEYPSELGACESVVELDGTTDVVKIEHLAPAEWPPRAGDLWRDRHGSVWFAFFGIEAKQVFMVPSAPVSGPLSTPSPDAVLAKVSPLTLVYREHDGGEIQ